MAGWLGEHAVYQDICSFVATTNITCMVWLQIVISLLDTITTCHCSASWEGVRGRLPDVSMRTGEGTDKPPLLLLLFCGRIRHSNRFGAGFASTYGQRLEYFLLGTELKDVALAGTADSSWPASRFG
jgi:hypothetical protein